MIPVEEMRHVTDFDEMDEKALEDISAIGTVMTAPAGTYLFHEGDHAAFYYVLKEGKVVLEFRQEDGSVLTETVGPGMGVGWSSLAGLMSYSSDARCAEASKFLRWAQSDLRHLFNQDGHLGYMMMKACAMSLNRRVAGKL
ncbi:MAG: cyclic nucleotide-binding domain-containing protein [Deltaproteobacteria bacterium]|nr:cyclic nucleotide-binding domain-containing protein [Deltaproteobacteria bacterium]